MALRAVPDHPKFAHLKSLLRMPKGAALGYLECVWHFAGRFTPQGNIGKYADTAIEAWVEWDGAPGALIDSLVESRWLDRDESFRLLVHDWQTHADKATKQALTRANLQFCVPTVHTPGAHSSVLSALPVPVPVPESEPAPEAHGSEIKITPQTPKETKAVAKWTLDDHFQMFASAAREFWKDLIEEDLSGWYWEWTNLDSEQRSLAIQRVKERISASQDWRKVFKPTYFTRGEWKRTIIPSANGNGNSIGGYKPGKEIRVERPKDND